MSAIRWQAQARSVETTVPCDACGACLSVIRSCHDVQVSCKACGRVAPLADVIAHADEAMERFLEGLYCDRM